MLTREEIAEIVQYCYENGVSYKSRLKEIGITEWQFYETKRRYADAHASERWRFRSKGTQKSDDYFGVKPPKKDSIINKKRRKIGSRASIFRSIATQLT